MQEDSGITEDEEGKRKVLQNDDEEELHKKLLHSTSPFAPIDLQWKSKARESPKKGKEESRRSTDLSLARSLKKSREETIQSRCTLTQEKESQKTLFGSGRGRNQPEEPPEISTIVRVPPQVLPSTSNSPSPSPSPTTKPKDVRSSQISVTPENSSSLFPNDIVFFASRTGKVNPGLRAVAFGNMFNCQISTNPDTLGFYCVMARESNAVNRKGISPQTLLNLESKSCRSSFRLDITDPKNPYVHSRGLSHNHPQTLSPPLTRRKETLYFNMAEVTALKSLATMGKWNDQQLEDLGRRFSRDKSDFSSWLAYPVPKYRILPFKVRATKISRCPMGQTPESILSHLENLTQFSDLKVPSIFDSLKFDKSFDVSKYQSGITTLAFAHNATDPFKKERLPPSIGERRDKMIEGIKNVKLGLPPANQEALTPFTSSSLLPNDIVFFEMTSRSKTIIRAAFKGQLFKQTESALKGCTTLWQCSKCTKKSIRGCPARFRISKMNLLIKGMETGHNHKCSIAIPPNSIAFSMQEVNDMFSLMKNSNPSSKEPWNNTVNESSVADLATSLARESWEIDLWLEVAKKDQRDFGPLFPESINPSRTDGPNIPLGSNSLEFMREAKSTEDNDACLGLSTDHYASASKDSKNISPPDITSMHNRSAPFHVPKATCSLELPGIRLDNDFTIAPMNKSTSSDLNDFQKGIIEEAFRSSKKKKIINIEIAKSLGVRVGLVNSFISELREMHRNWDDEERDSSFTQNLLRSPSMGSAPTHEVLSAKPVESQNDALLMKSLINDTNDEDLFQLLKPALSGPRAAALNNIPTEVPNIFEVKHLRHRGAAFVNERTSVPLTSDPIIQAINRHHSRPRPTDPSYKARLLQDSCFTSLDQEGFDAIPDIISRLQNHFSLTLDQKTTKSMTGKKKKGYPRQNSWEDRMEMSTLWRVNPKRGMERVRNPVMKKMAHILRSQIDSLFPKPDPSVSSDEIRELFNSTSCKRASHGMECDEFSKWELKAVLSNLKNSATGPDKLSNWMWSKFDPDMEIRTKMFNLCIRHGDVPADWKKSNVVFINKVPHPTAGKDFRPLALQNSIYKQFTKCLSKRLLSWSDDVLSNMSKGFREYEGCHDHNFILKSIIHEERKERRGLCVVSTYPTASTRLNTRPSSKS